MARNNLYQMTAKIPSTSRPRRTTGSKHREPGLRDIIDGVFADFTRRIQQNDFFNFHNEIQGNRVIESLNESIEFKQLACDLVTQMGVPEENITALVSYIAYFVMCGCAIDQAQIMASKLGTIIGA